MANDFFRFKEFIVQQGKCSMKVCTDSCLLGSMLPVSAGGEEIIHVLDIGAGTGVLSLMYAQKNAKALIDALEIEKNAFEQAKENFLSSKWNKRLKIFNTDAKDFISTKKYDLIICNPPFYENDLLSDDQNKNLAKHDEGLPLKDLIAITGTHLAATGCFAILLPFHRIQFFENLAKENKFFLQQKLLIRQTPEHNFFRGILFFGNAKTGEIINELSIKDQNCYTSAFMYLLKDYYLHL